MPEPAGITFEREAWLALVAAIEPAHRAAALVAALEAQRLEAEFTEAERAAYAASALGDGWLYGSDELGWFPRNPGRHTRAGADGGAVIVDPPKRVLGTDRRGDPITVIDGPPVPTEGVHGLLRHGVIRELEELGGGLLGGIAYLDPAPLPWRAEPAEGAPLAGAWLLDAKGRRIGWLPASTDAHHIARDVNELREQRADTYRLGALRDSLSRLRQVTEPDERYQPPPELAALHAEARAAVERLLAALPAWAMDCAPLVAPAPASPVSVTAPGGSLSWLLVLLLGILLGWLARGFW